MVFIGLCEKGTVGMMQIHIIGVDMHDLPFVLVMFHQPEHNFVLHFWVSFVHLV